MTPAPPAILASRVSALLEVSGLEEEKGERGDEARAAVHITPCLTAGEGRQRAGTS